MKALIFNSGIGKRMGDMTKDNPKAMVKLLNNETIFERQIRLLSNHGIKEFVITTGPYEEMFKAIANKECYKHLVFHFVHNDIYDKTNYIYSFYLARDLIDDDFVVLHGDLVFNDRLLYKAFKETNENICFINKKKSLPEKDFKGRIDGNRLKEVSINIFDDNCYAFQPFYKLDKKTITLWINKVVEYVEQRNITGVYAENALNEILKEVSIIPKSYHLFFLEEIDNIADYKRVSKGIIKYDYEEQKELQGINSLEVYRDKKPLIVLDKFLLESQVFKELQSKFSSSFSFSSFNPNPQYIDVVNAYNAYKDNNCNMLIAIGGGTSIDIAKSVKWFLGLEDVNEFINVPAEYINIPLIAIPTTAGTGSECTHFAVLYKDGTKLSLDNPSILPTAYLLYPKFLSSLPLRQKKATYLDALCQGIESIWAKGANSQSQSYAKKAVSILFKDFDSYFSNDEKVYKEIMKASSLAGKAINISKTTAGHAMSYKLTSLLGIPHGEAVAICMREVFRFYAEKLGNCKDIDNKTLRSITGINKCFKCNTIKESYLRFISILDKLSIEKTIKCFEKQYIEIINGVNVDRLGNFPLSISKEEITSLYSFLTI